MRFSRREVMLYRLKIKSKTAIVAEINVEKVQVKCQDIFGRY